MSGVELKAFVKALSTRAYHEKCIFEDRPMLIELPNPDQLYLFLICILPYLA